MAANTRPSTGRVLLVDRHPMMLEALSALFERELPGWQVMTAATIAEADRSLSGQPACQIIILDAEVPDAFGFAGFLKLQDRCPAASIALFSDITSQVFIDAARTLGAAGVLTRNIDSTTFVDAIREMLKRQVPFVERLAR